MWQEERDQAARELDSQPSDARCVYAKSPCPVNYSVQFYIRSYVSLTRHASPGQSVPVYCGRRASGNH